MTYSIELMNVPRSKHEKYVIVLQGFVVDDCDGWGYKSTWSARRGFSWRLSKGGPFINQTLDEYRQTVNWSREHFKKWVADQRRKDEEWKPTKTTRRRTNYKL